MLIGSDVRVLWVSLHVHGQSVHRMQACSFIVSQQSGYQGLSLLMQLVPSLSDMQVQRIAYALDSAFGKAETGFTQCWLISGHFPLPAPYT